MVCERNELVGVVYSTAVDSVFLTIDNRGIGNGNNKINMEIAGGCNRLVYLCTSIGCFDKNEH